MPTLDRLAAAAPYVPDAGPARRPDGHAYPGTSGVHSRPISHRYGADRRPRQQAARSTVCGARTHSITEKSGDK
jgi:hypothetical protein